MLRMSQSIAEVLSQRDSTRVGTLSSLLGFGMVFVAAATAIGQPSNDDFEGRHPLIGLPTKGVGFIYAATSELGEPAHGGAPAGHSVWWTWTSPGTGSVGVSID